MAVARRSAQLAEGRGERTDGYSPGKGGSVSQTTVRGGSGTQPNGTVDSNRQTSLDAARHRGSWPHFLGHVAEMVIAMMVGMPVGVGIFSSIVGESYKASRHDHPTAALLVMAVSMTIPMVAWMRFRRHTWRNSMEMGTAMMLPAVPFFALLWCNVFRDAPTGPYMSVSSVAMLALMLYRWNVYSVHVPTSIRRRAR